MNQSQEWINPELRVVFGSRDCPIRSLVLARPRNGRGAACLARPKTASRHRLPRHRTLGSDRPDQLFGKPTLHVVERWRDPLRSTPSFPLTFGPTRIVIPLARYRK